MSGTRERLARRLEEGAASFKQAAEDAELEREWERGERLRYWSVRLLLLARRVGPEGGAA